MQVSLKYFQNAIGIILIEVLSENYILHKYGNEINYFDLRHLDNRYYFEIISDSFTAKNERFQLIL